MIAEKSLDLTAFAQFDALLSKENLWASVEYINIVCPRLVADRERLAKCAASLEKNAISRIDFSVLYTIGKLDAGISLPEELSEEDTSYLENVLNIPMPLLSEVWASICSRPCPKAEPISTSRRISVAMAAYNRLIIPYAKLLQDTLEIQLHKKELEKAINQWERLQQIYHRKYESGVTAEETAFLNSAI